VEILKIETKHPPQPGTFIAPLSVHMKTQEKCKTTGWCHR